MLHIAIVGQMSIDEQRNEHETETVKIAIDDKYIGKHHWHHPWQRSA